MAIRWVLCPVVEVEETDEAGGVVRFRAPKVATIIDPGRGKPYFFAALVGPEFALCKVRGMSFAPLNNDPEILDVLTTDYEADYNSPGILYMTPRQLVWPAFKEYRQRKLWEIAGVDTRGLELGGYTVKQVLERIALSIGAQGDIDSVKV